jgi:tetratricopeptide (TPR) repeat protein
MKIGEELRNQSKPRESLKYYKQANEVCLKLTREQGSAQAEIVFWIASNMSELGYYDEAIRYYEQEIAIR